ncbi:MAG TPA: plastocyanin/azurin family copper-binding protein [Gemmatimonadaceae bacterium]|nr:plastocyanin/azurin family copper-binding protein [Gemmatimonadaceae bacterium]
MRFKGLALVVSAFAFTACGGGDNNSDTAAATTTDTAAATATPAATATGATAAAAPITGQTHEVRMVGDDKGYRFEPAELKIKAGDGVKWIMVSGGPHNVDFSQGAGAAANALTANMPNQMAPLSSPYFSNPNEAYTVSFANVPAGSYDYICTPHAAMNMKGKIIVE